MEWVIEWGSLSVHNCSTSTSRQLHLCLYNNLKSIPREARTLSPSLNKKILGSSQQQQKYSQETTSGSKLTRGPLTYSLHTLFKIEEGYCFYELSYTVLMTLPMTRWAGGRAGGQISNFKLVFKAMQRTCKDCPSHICGE